ncbi:MAG: hypothetical protein GX913_07460 [Clostridiales bacterium]|nr:hypothetical protein [Clostridiales bacterium]
MNKNIYFYLFAGIFLFLIIKFYYHQRENKRNFLYKAKKHWGQIPEREYEYEEFERISHYFRNKEGITDSIDDITWNDLNMDHIFMLMNNTYSSIGEEYLYMILRTPLFDDKVLKERNRLSEFFGTHEEVRLKLQVIFAQMGRVKGISVSDYINRLHDVENTGNGVHYSILAATVLSFITIFIYPLIGIPLFILVLSYNIFQYYKLKGKVEAYFSCFGQIAKMLNYSKNISKLGIDEIQEYTDEINKIFKELATFRKGTVYLSANNMTGSPLDLIMDYVRIITHIDLIKFNSMLKVFNNKKAVVERLLEVLGKLESGIAIASFRENLEYYSYPEFVEEKKTKISFKDIYHPAIENPVVNSLEESQGVLVTGSNASGKSTFLKTVAINAILSQTIYTSLAKAYKANYFNIMSSMALQDDLMSNESYYIVEIKSLKRILDKVNEYRPILCCIDEVLRGTNTIERIAASGQILKSLAKENVICFAATHDIELTHMLENHYSNYHFQEEVVQNDIKFDYILYSGRAVSRNAIKLLSVLGYENIIIEDANKSAENFLGTGIWAL